MSANPYTAPGAGPAAGAPAHLAGRILAPLLVPLLLHPVLLGVLTTVVTGVPLSLPALGGAIASMVPLAIVALVTVSPVVMLCLLPWKRLTWPWRGLLAAVIQLVVVGVIAAALFQYMGSNPIEVRLPAPPAGQR